MTTTERILDCRGIYIYKKNNSIIIEALMSKTSSKGIFSWERLSPREFLKQFDKELLADFFISNPNNLPTSSINRLWDPLVVNGIYILQGTNRGWDLAINVNRNTSVQDLWTKLNIFDTNLNNHICDFILNL